MLWKPTNYNGETYTWEPDKENRCLNGYDRLVFFYLENYVHDRNMIYIRNINTILLELIKKLDIKLCYSILSDMVKYADDYHTNATINQILFYKLYGAVQAIQTRDYDSDGNIIEFVKIDGSGVIGFNDDKEDLSELIKVTF